MQCATYVPPTINLKTFISGWVKYIRRHGGCNSVDVLRVQKMFRDCVDFLGDRTAVTISYQCLIKGTTEVLFSKDVEQRHIPELWPLHDFGESPEKVRC